jgi:dsDNA-specific endonuclease/ATPase MutS2
MNDEDQPIELPIDGVIDLHTFRPQDVKDVVLGFIDECEGRGIYDLRIIHGKGIGQLRNTVHALLKKHPKVESFSLASEYYGGSGATIVHLVSGSKSAIS